MSAIFSALVDAGMTATKGRPISRAKYASMTAEPEPIQPLHRAYRKRDRASRCLRLAVGCTDSSLRYNSMPSTGIGSTCQRCDSHRLRRGVWPVSYTHLRAHETVLDLVCRLLLEKK